MASVFAQLARKASQVPPLSEAEELRLIRAYRRDASASALERLVSAHLGLIIALARRIPVSDSMVGDLINEGVIGFIRAVEIFDETKQRRLNVIAKFYVKARMSDYALSNMPYAQPFHSRDQRKVFYHIRKLHNPETTSDGLITARETAEIAKKLGVENDDVMYVAERLSGRDVSLDGQIVGHEGESASLSEIIPDASPIAEEYLIQKDEREEWSVAMRAAMGRLPERERKIVADRRLKDPPVPLEVLALELGVTKGRVSQLETQGLSRLKEFLVEDDNNSKKLTATSGTRSKIPT